MEYFREFRREVPRETARETPSEILRKAADELGRHSFRELPATELSKLLARRLTELPNREGALKELLDSSGAKEETIASLLEKVRNFRVGALPLPIREALVDLLKELRSSAPKKEPGHAPAGSYDRWEARLPQLPASGTRLREPGAEVPAECMSEMEFLRTLAVLHRARVDFVKKFDVKVLGPGKVSFIIPAGLSRLDVLLETQTLIKSLYARAGVCEKYLSPPKYDSFDQLLSSLGHDSFERPVSCWLQSQAFTAKVEKDTPVVIDGCIEDSRTMDDAQQRARCWNNAGRADVATAHQVFLAATGEDMFRGFITRVAEPGEALFLSDEGLVEVELSPEYDDHAASAREGP